MKTKTKKLYSVIELTKEQSLNFEFSDDAYFRVDFTEEADFIPIRANFVCKDPKGQRNITANLVKAEYLPKNHNRSFGKYKCTYEEI